MSEEKFSKCEKGEKCLSVVFRVFEKKMEIERKVPEKKNQSLFGWKFRVWDFAKFVFTGWALYWFANFKLQKKNGNFQSVFRSGLKFKVVGNEKKNDCGYRARA